MNNKRGQTTLFLAVGIILAILCIIALIIVGIVTININSALDQDITIGQVNLKTINAQSFGYFNFMVVNHADFIGICIIFGIIIGLFLSAYFLRNRYPKIMVLIDIGLILAAFIFSLYIRGVYSDLVIALDSAGQTFASDNLSKTNFFILNLPIFVTIIGVIMMILFHAGIPRKPDELNIYQQGVVTG